jgi:hypothetical protein
MKTILQTAVLALGLAGSFAAQAKVDVNVGVTIREPGVYGRIEVGTAAPPVYSPQPVIIQQVPVVVGQPVVVQPVYLYAPRGHQKKWHKHCHKYNACGQQVYFVREDWVRESYQQAHPDWRPAPRPAVMQADGHHGKHEGKHHGKGHGKGKKDD